MEVLQYWATTGCVAAAALCWVLFIAFLVFAAPSSSLDEAEAQAAQLTVSKLSVDDVFWLIGSWAAPLAAVLFTLLARRVAPRDAGRPAAPSALRRLAAAQLPPRGLWAAACGGVSGAEAAGVAVYLFVAAWWLGQGIDSELKGRADWRDQLNGVGVALGNLLAPHLALLFLPVPRTNALTWLTGVPRTHLVRYHRWLGHATMWVLSAHGIAFYIYWGATDSFGVNFSTWEMSGSVSNLAGSTAWFAGLLLWGSSLQFVRRRFYEVFYRLHIPCFLAFFLLALAHYPPCWRYFAPGLLLYAADLVLRAGQAANLSAIAAAEVDAASGVATLRLRADPVLRHRPLSEAWVLLPMLSRWQWHPFTIASGGGSAITMHVKTYGGWTSRLAAALRARQPLAVRWSGPMGAEEAPGAALTPPPRWAAHAALVLVCGGVGCTPILALLRALARARAGGGGAGAHLPHKVVCLWTARSMGEFLALDRQLLLAACAQDGWLSLRLHLTGLLPPPPPKSPPAKRHQGRVTPGDDGPSAPTFNLVAVAGGGAAPGAPPLPPRLPRASAFGWDLLRPAQPLSLGVLHLASVFCLVYVGGFAGVLLGTSYLSQLEQGWKGGMVIAVLLSSVALGLGYAAVWPVHWIRYLDTRHAEALGDAAATVAPYADQAALARERCVVEGPVLRLPGPAGAALKASPGRPDVRAVLRAAAAEAGPGAVVGVYSGGPGPLLLAVRAAVGEVNREAVGGAWLELHEETVEL